MVRRLAALTVVIVSLALFGAFGIHAFGDSLLARVVLFGLIATIAGVVVPNLGSSGSAGAGVTQTPMMWWQIVRTLALVVFLLLLLVAISIYVQELEINRWTVTQLVFVGLFSAAVGYAELLSRYRDDPGRLLAADPAAAYITVNMIAGIAALALVKEFAVFGTAKAPQPHQSTYEVLLASFGAIAFFRTSLFTVRVGTADVGIGPSTLLKSVLDASDQMVDRKQALGRADDVTRIMAGVDFEKAKATLSALCLTLVQGATEDQQKLVAEQIKKLADDKSIVPASKATILGVYLVRQVGAAVLDRAVAALGNQIK
jgi:hypothetical protein